MENINIGIVNLIISKKISNAYFSNNINENKEVISGFFDIIKNSPILQLEFKVFNNLENKHIINELSATRYIDTNIKLFETYTIDEIENERKKLLPFIDESVIDKINDCKFKLYKAIDILIKESLKDYNDVDVDGIHDSFTLILNHIKQNKILKINLTENTDKFLINEDVIKIAIDKFNDKYSSLDENEGNLIKKLINFNQNEKQNLLEEYKTENLKILEQINNVKFEEKIPKTIQKINEMSFNTDTVDDDIIDLHELKKGLL